MNREDLENRLAPKHLTEIKEELEKKAESAKEPEPPYDPRLEREYTFQFDHKDGRGKHWGGEFTNKILTIKDRQMVGVMRATLSSNVPVESLDALTAELNLMLAHLTFSLKKRPEWAEELQSLEDVSVLQALYEEVLGHEAMFLGYGIGPEKSTS